MRDWDETGSQQGQSTSCFDESLWSRVRSGPAYVDHMRQRAKYGLCWSVADMGRSFLHIAMSLYENLRRGFWSRYAQLPPLTAKQCGWRIHIHHREDHGAASTSNEVFSSDRKATRQRRKAPPKFSTAASWSDPTEAAKFLTRSGDFEHVPAVYDFCVEWVGFPKDFVVYHGLSSFFTLKSLKMYMSITIDPWSCLKPPAVTNMSTPPPPSSQVPPLELTLWQRGAVESFFFNGMLLLWHVDVKPESIEDLNRKTLGLKHWI